MNDNKAKELIAVQLFLLSVFCDDFPIIITDELVDKVYKMNTDHPSVKKMLENLESSRSKMYLGRFIENGY